MTRSNNAENTEKLAEQTEKIPEKEREDIFIPRAAANDDPNLFVSINGVNYLLPRGKTSNVPKYVADEIRRSERAAERQNSNIDALLEASK